jgi:polar amino acid transport system permease protein
MFQTLSTTHFLYIAGAIGWTLGLSLVAFLGGMLGGFAIALLATASRRALRAMAKTHIVLFQGTPLIVLLIVCYFGLPTLGLELSAFASAAIALGLYASAFLGDIWRGCIEAVPDSQREAGLALGLSPMQVRWLVILPQTFRIALPPTAGFLVQVIKGTSLASVVGFVELSHAGQQVANDTLQSFLVFGFVACLYFLLCFPLTEWSEHLERKLSAGTRVRKPVA